jgi:ubiquinone/menaquinone biosynthesis C-methylase UbiE
MSLIVNYLAKRRLEKNRTKIKQGQSVSTFNSYALGMGRLIEIQRSSESWQRLFALLRNFCIGAQTMLDVGCGPYELLAVSNTPTSIGTDISKVPLRFLRESGFRGHLVQADSLHLPFSDLSINALVCNQVIEHMPTQEDAKILVSETERVSNRIMIVTPNAAYSRKVMDSTHFLFFTSRSLKKITDKFQLYCFLPLSGTLAYYLVLEDPRLAAVPIIGRATIEALRKIDSSMLLAYINRKLWGGIQLVAVKT